MNRKTLTIRCAVYHRYNMKQSRQDRPAEERRAREMVNHHHGCVLLPDHIYYDQDSQWSGLTSLLEAVGTQPHAFDAVLIQYLTDLGESYSSAISTLNQLTRRGVLVKFEGGQMDSSHPGFAVTLSAMTGCEVEVFDGRSRP